VKIVIFLVVLTVWLVLCCVFLGKIKKTGLKTALIIVTVVLFILFGTAVTGILAVSGAALHPEKGILRITANEANEYLKLNYGGLKIVQTGIEEEELPEAVNDLDSIVPRSVVDFMHTGSSLNMLENAYRKFRAWGFDILRNEPERVTRFVEPGELITSVDIIKAAEWEVASLINRIVFRVVLIHSVIMALYFGLCIFLGLKKPSAKAAAE